MRSLARLLILLLLTATPVAAQEEDDKTYLENKLQELLSGAGRAVTITGFEGALSSQARLQEMTIADSEGVWLTLRNAQLDWTRSALFAGRLEIDALSAGEIEITRRPISETALSPGDAAAAPFALPDLPVAVNIERLDVARITLAPGLLGEAATLTLTGAIMLADGQGDAQLDIRRLDRDDRLTLDGGFANESRVLRLNTDFEEAEDGLVSTLLSIPGAPSLGLRIAGEAPLSDFAAQIALSSDGQERFGGQVTIGAEAETGAHAVSANLEGDVRPLFAPGMHPFFGDRAQLATDLVLSPDGRKILDRLEITSRAMALSGTMALAADGWPERFRFTGRIGDGSAVRLPTAGAETTVAALRFDAGYDAAENDSWQADLVMDAFARDGLHLDQARLSGTGQITRAPQQSLSGVLDFAVDALDPGNPDLARALGPDPSGQVTFGWQPDAPFVIAPLVLQSGDMNLTLNAELDQLAEGLPIQGTARLLVNDNARFSGLAGRDLTGVAIAELSGRLTALSGAFDLTLEAETQDLSIAEPRLDPLLARQTALRILARRDEAGLRLRGLTLENDAARISASGLLGAEAGALDLTAALDDLALVEPKLSGAGDVRARMGWQAGQPVRLEVLEAQIGQTAISGTGQIDPNAPTLPVEGELTVTSADLSRFARLLGRPLAGQMALELQGTGEARGENFDLGFDLTGDRLRTGIAPLDTLVAGQVAATGSAALDAEAIELRYLKLSSPGLRMNATGSGPAGPIALSAQLRDIAVLTNSIAGPAAIRGTLTFEERRARQISLNMDASGPGGIAGQIAGRITEYGQGLDLSLRGTGPLQLANQFISPRSVQGDMRFDLALSGPPELTSLSGEASFAQARVSLPQLEMVLGDLSGALVLGAGRVAVDVSGNTGQAGRFQLSGPIGLSPPFAADLALRLSGLGLTDGQLYDTTVNGDLSIAGALRGGARIGGTITLGRTELRVPSGSGAIIGTLPELRHTGEPAAVAQTRARAGLIQRESGPAPDFPLDVTINAPNQIFVRGRGLDAELGGNLRLTGSTNNVVPSGVFELIRGRLDILGKRLEMTEGLIDLRGALDPYLRFVAETTAGDVLVQVLLEGLLSAPEVSFTSEPALPQDEIVARLLFGRGLDTISPFQAVQLVSAVAQLTGRYDGGLVGNLRQSLGLSDFDVSTTEDGATQLRAGAYLSDNIYSEVTADSEGKQQINLNLDVSDHVIVRGRADNQGDTGIGVFFEKDY